MCLKRLDGDDPSAYSVFSVVYRGTHLELSVVSSNREFVILGVAATIYAAVS